MIRANTAGRFSKGWIRFLKQWELHLMVWPVIIWLLIFSYYPMLGIQIAFKNFKFAQGMWASPWVGLKYFKEFFTDPYITTALRNTLGISLIKVFLMFPIPIIFALLLNEVRNQKFKKVAQTISYFPYFFSWPLLALLLTMWLSPSTGLVNEVLVSLGILKQPVLFLGEPKAFWWISYAIIVWKETGWGSIIYLAALSGLDQEVLEAAVIDGVNKMQRIFYIIIPYIKSTIMILFILNMGSFLGGGLYGSNFTISYLLGNPINKPYSDILDTYIYTIGIGQARFSYAAAVGLLLSIVSFILLLGSNSASRKITGEDFF